MAFEQRELSGQLFKNARKTEEKHPNAQGSCLIEGVEYFISAWTKKDKNGNPWQSLSFKRKDVVQGAGIEKARDAIDKPTQPDFNDDIPF
jgi:hypothetical protein